MCNTTRITTTHNPLPALPETEINGLVEDFQLSYRRNMV